MAYDISKKYALAANEGDSRVASKWYIIAHDTGNDNNKGTNSAGNEASYMKGHYNSAYTHFIVDDKHIYQVGEPGYVAWGALDANPYSPMQVELAHVNSQKRFNESYKRYIWLIRYYAKKYNIPLTLDAGGTGTKGIKSHNWCTKHYGGSHVDPYGYLKKWGVSKAQFAKDIKNGLGGTSTVVKDEYYKTKGLYEVKVARINAYNDVAFKSKRYVRFTKGTRFYANVVQYGKITRFKTSMGYFSSNKKYVKFIKKID